MSANPFLLQAPNMPIIPQSKLVSALDLSSTQMNRVRNSCWGKCIHNVYDMRLEEGEMECLERCVVKQLEKNKLIIWLYEQKDIQLEGILVGFDEYMNIVFDKTVEYNLKKDTRKELGRILIKGENIVSVFDPSSMEK